VKTPYDNGWKRLLDICTQDLLSWIAGDVVFAGRRSEEFESVKIDADLMLEASHGDQKVFMHIEAQSTPDDDMAQRLLEYNALAYRRYQCPIMSYVIYLRKGGKRPKPPLIRLSPAGKELLRFHYEVIELEDYAAKELFATGLRGILPLVPFSHDGKRREVIEEIIARLLPAHDTIDKELLALTQLFASLVFKEDEQDWLIRRFTVLQDIFRDTPVYKHIFAQGKEEGKEEGIVLGIKQGIEKERQEIVQGVRQTLLTLVAERFPKLKTLAKGQLSLIEQPQILDNLILKIALARTQEEAQDYLLTWNVQSET